jgi:uncharacterized protein (TIGR02145 family)/uncharacterized repeat protein (TIGR02543 family)
MALPSSCNNSSCASQINANHRGICPSGWHIPSNAEWTTLTDFVGSTAGTELRAASGWNDYNGKSGNGTDAYSFSALPGGYGYSDGSFSHVGNGGYWWAKEFFAYGTDDRRYDMYCYDEAVDRYWGGKDYLFSIRCLQDNSSVPPSSSSVLPSSSSALPSSSSTPPSSSSVATYTVTYNANNGTGAPANQTKTHDAALTLSTDVPTRTGYAFAGWNTSSNGSGMSYASGASYVDNAGVTLYAQWTVNTYTVTYNANNGTGAPANQTKTHDVALTLSSAVPARAGYIFVNWNTSANGSGTSYASGASYTANASLTLYAQWGIDASNCEGQTFSTVVIGTQTWMAENLNCNVSGSKCYNNNESMCATYGRLYDWATAMALPDCGYGTSCASQIGEKHKGICPTGWHIPSDAEWTALTDFVGSTAGTELKATSGWNSCGSSGSGSSNLCEDSHGFAALPGGGGYSGGYFSNVGYDGYWWSSSENNASYAYIRRMYYYDDGVYWDYYNKSYLFSVRCLQD